MGSRVHLNIPDGSSRVLSDPSQDHRWKLSSSFPLSLDLPSPSHPQYLFGTPRLLDSSRSRDLYYPRIPTGPSTTLFPPWLHFPSMVMSLCAQLPPGKFMFGRSPLFDMSSSKSRTRERISIHNSLPPPRWGIDHHDHPPSDSSVAHNREDPSLQHTTLGEVFAPH